MLSITNGSMFTCSVLIIESAGDTNYLLKYDLIIFVKIFILSSFIPKREDARTVYNQTRTGNCSVDWSY
jgi:hypothetical protein